MTVSCPNCGSSRVRGDGDYVEELVHPDRGQGASYFYDWYECEDCNYQWRDQPVADEPVLDLMSGLIAGAICVFVLVVMSIVSRL